MACRLHIEEKMNEMTLWYCGEIDAFDMKLYRVLHSLE